MHTETYYTSMERLVSLFETSSRSYGFQAKNLSEFEEWKQSTRAKLRDIIGMSAMVSCELQPRLLETEQLVGFRREKWLIQTEPDVWMPFYVLIPESIAEGQRVPCVIAPHGHESGGKLSVAGRDDIPEIRAQIEKYNYDYGVQFVRSGFIVFCPDARAFGERREWTMQGDDPASFINSSCSQLNHMAIGLGQSLTGMWIWDLMRLADYIETRPDCGEIGCAGLSGGGLQALWLTALDERIRCTVVSGYFYGYKEALLKLSNNCACNYVPNLWKYIDMGDLGAMITPRPLLIESGSRDPLNGESGIDNVTEQVKITRAAYRLCNSEHLLKHYVFDGEHRWDGAQTYDFMKRFMAGL
jgi:hypothetical protein